MYKQRVKKSKKIKKKIVKRLIFLFLLVLVISIIVLSILNSHKKERILKRLNAGFSNLNYTYYLDDSKSSVQVYGKYEKHENSQIIKYIDNESKITNEIMPNADKEYRVEYKNKGISEMQYYKLCINKYFDDDFYNYKYIGKKEYNGIKCTVVDFREANPKNLLIDGIKLWINDDLNVVEKIEYYYYKNDKEKTYYVRDCQFHTDVNKLEDVKIPDYILNEYSTRLETGG